MHTRVYTCIHRHTSMPTRLCVRIRTRVRVHSVCRPMRIHACTHTVLYAMLRVYTRVHAHIHVFSHYLGMYTRVRTCTHAAWHTVRYVCVRIAHGTALTRVPSHAQYYVYTRAHTRVFPLSRHVHTCTHTQYCTQDGAHAHKRIIRVPSHAQYHVYTCAHTRVFPLSRHVHT